MGLRYAGQVGGQTLLQDESSGAIIMSPAEPRIIVDDVAPRPQRPTDPETERLARSAVLKAEQGRDDITPKERAAFLRDHREQVEWLDAHPQPAGTIAQSYNDL